MKYNYIVIEDNPAAAQNLKIELNRYDYLINAGEADTYQTAKM